MATLEQIQEISNRGLQGRLSPDKRAKFDELVSRGLITSPEITGGELPSEAARIPQAAAPSPVSSLAEETGPQTEGGIVNTLDKIIIGGVEALGAIG